MKPKLTIVVPVYNAEKFIVGTLKKISKLSLNDYEVIIIDDGSTDGSYKICENYCNENNKFNVYHTTNHGVSAARNYGIKKATGKYIAFIDADDWVDPYIYKKCVNELDKNGYDIALFGMEFDIKSKRHSNLIMKKSCPDCYIPKDKLPEIFKLLYDHNYITSMCNKVIRSSLLNDNQLFFDENISNYEDMLLNWKLLLHLKEGIIVFSDCAYHYEWINPQSNAKKYKKDLTDTTEFLIAELLETLKKLPLDKKIKSYVRCDLQRLLWQAVSNICKSKDTFITKRMLIKNICLQKWVTTYLPMRTNDNKYNNINVYLWMKKMWGIMETFNVLVNLLRTLKY